jgi:hypothetical protein
MELSSGILSRDEYLRAIARVIEFMAGAGVQEVSVAYGFGCDCPDEQLYQDMQMPLYRLWPFIAEAERLDYYRVGQDNLHVWDGAGRFELLFCHEADIHFISEDKALADEFCTMFARLGA